MTNPNPIRAPKFVGGYYPQGKDWKVKFGAVVAGKMMAQIIQNGTVIAKLTRPGTAEEIMSAAKDFMEAQS